MAAPPTTNITKHPDAREMLLAAGLNQFSEYGFNGTSTRNLCKEAQTNISAISYYFGSKEGLYLSVVKHIIDLIREQAAPLKLQALLLIEQPNTTKDQAIAAIQHILSGMTRIFMTNSLCLSWSRILIREQTHPTSAFDDIYTRHIGELLQILAQLIATVTCLPADHDIVKIHAHALFGQALIFLIGQQSLKRHLGIQEFDQHRIKIICDTINHQVKAYLAGAVNTEKIDEKNS